MKVRESSHGFVLPDKNEKGGKSETIQAERLKMKIYSDSDTATDFGNYINTYTGTVRDNINTVTVKVPQLPVYGISVGEAMKFVKFDIDISDSIEKVIFHEPATIVLWKDGTKTVVKCGEHEYFDPEKGLAMAIIKKLSGNKGNYNNIFKKHIKPTEYKNIGEQETTEEAMTPLEKFMKDTKEYLDTLVQRR